MDKFKFAMHRESEADHLDRVRLRRLLIEGAVSVESRDIWERSPLHWAAERGQCKMVEFLISNNCDLNLKDRHGRTPVMVAADFFRKRVVELLLQHGAQVNCTDDDGLTLLHYVSLTDWTDVICHIVDTGEADLNAAATRDGCTPLIQAATNQQGDVASLLILAGADVNLSDEGKWTALHWASQMNRTRVVQVLLEKEGLHLNHQDEEGETPLHKACYGGYGGVIKQLLVAGADISIKNNEGETALSLGIRRGKFTTEEIWLFVQQGAFLQDCDYSQISRNPVLKESALKDVGLCTQSIVNKFHCQSLPTLGSISYFTGKLPKIDKFKLKARQIDEVRNLVKYEIEQNTFCNVVKAHPIALTALCVLSLITCQSGTKKSASPDFGDSNSPFKKLRT